MRGIFSRFKFLAAGAAGALGGCVGTSQALTATVGSPGLGTPSANNVSVTVGAVVLQVQQELTVNFSGANNTPVPEPTVTASNANVTTFITPIGNGAWSLTITGAANGTSSVTVTGSGLQETIGIIVG